MEPLGVVDYERLGKRALEPARFSYFAGGAEDERTLRDNLAAFAGWRLCPRVLAEVGAVSTGTTVLGTDVSMPVPRRPSLSSDWRMRTGLAADSGLPVIVKGVLTADARLACEPGAAGLVVSNHAGRRLDGVTASIDALSEVVEAVEGRIEVLVDGGVRRGTDVVKALALGARAVLIGRPFLWALAVGGERGVRHVLELLREKLALALAQVGCPSTAAVTWAHVARRI